MKGRTAILACVAALVAATGAEAQLPPGSYKDTCTNETVTGNTLKAKCRTMAGTVMDTSLNLPCAGMVDNVNGKLVCKPMPPGLPRPAPKPPSPPAVAPKPPSPPAVAPKPPSGAALPPGSYKDSCSGEAVSGNVLRARCRTIPGTWVDSTLTLPCAGKIENRNGRLTCVARVPGR